MTSENTNRKPYGDEAASTKSALSSATRPGKLIPSSKAETSAPMSVRSGVAGEKP
eukprot:CAMPEP_0115190364 /NCGR_PEP_ID=MMETSP0270-20121206/11987_1 /TAXON_ID=71861 /ORGANISM="Scrippsiella trochoidea, Strain CCMP3099" /LENGTH=54 /DNA_ID=CAMNT_0002603573 /DNA_START=367 /DNA_END=531 /DNA_ORIENTATION=-